jgi:hypothetical protein
MGTGRVMDIMDISNPQSPVKLGSVTLKGFVYSIDVSGNYAYTALYIHGLQVVDISNPASPTVVGAYDTPGYARDVQVVGSYAYIADFHKGLRILQPPLPPLKQLTWKTWEMSGGYLSPDRMPMRRVGTTGCGSSTYQPPLHPLKWDRPPSWTVVTFLCPGTMPMWQTAAMVSG